MIIIGYDGSLDARAAIKQAGMLMPGYPALVLTVWGPPAPEGLSEQDIVRSPAHTRAEDLAGRVGGWAMIAFACVNLETPGKLTAHAYSYEHMELAAYELLARVARRGGDDAVVELASRIGRQEQAMAERLAENFDAAVTASLRDKQADDLRAELVSYLADAHAIEAQARQLLRTGPKIVGFDELARIFRAHLEETEEHQRRVEERLHAHDAQPSRFQDTSMRVGGLNVGAFFATQPDTPIKLAGFAYAFEHLEVAAYELLARVARAAAISNSPGSSSRGGKSSGSGGGSSQSRRSSGRGSGGNRAQKAAAGRKGGKKSS